jgi:hypothetical protein
VSSPDLSKLIQDWPYEPDKISVRKIIGGDNRIKIQMRVDLGLLQMDADGRPDGGRPHGCDSLLDHHRRQLEEHERRNGTTLGFQLSSEEVRALGDEVNMYYQRYLAYFVLEEFDKVERDTASSLAAIDLCREYAEDAADRLRFVPLRPYVMMMHTRAKVYQALAESALRTAVAHIDVALSDISDHFDTLGQPEAYKASAEVKFLEALRDEVATRLPEDALTRLRRELNDALREENYEEAAKLRDKIAALSPRPAATDDRTDD